MNRDELAFKILLVILQSDSLRQSIVTNVSAVGSTPADLFARVAWVQADAFIEAGASVPRVEQAESAIAEALDVAKNFGGTDGAHHKDWVIDQIVRRLTGDGYLAFVAEVKAGGDGPDTYEWNEGIAP